MSSVKIMSETQQSKLGSLRGEVREILSKGRDAWRLVPRVRKLSLGAALLVMCVSSAASTAIPVTLGRLVDAVSPASTRGMTAAGLRNLVASYLALIGVAYLIREGLNVLRRYLVENTCTQIDRDMCVRLVGHLLKVDLSTLTHEQVGALHGRICRSVDGLVRFLRIGFLDFVPALLLGAFALTAAVSKQPKIALVMIGVAPISVALTLWQLVTQRGVRLGLLRSREAMDGTIVEQLGGLDYIRVAHTHGLEIQRVEHAAERRRSQEIQHHFEMSLFGSGKALNEGIFHLLVIAFAIGLYLHGGVRYGDILTFSVLFMNVMAPLNEIHRFIDEAHESSIRVGDLVKLLDEPHDRSFRVESSRAPALVVGEPILLSEGLRVEYRCPDGILKHALKDVSLEIRHGETIGIAGRSGCGKTTWLRILMRLIHPSDGNLFVGGVPIESISRETIGDLIGYVGQNPFLFAGTIYENIAYGMPGVSFSDVMDAARKACIHEEIMGMPDTYQTAIAERGQSLSGGQRQRIALARVFLKNPPILVLDEGTSALDNISERAVQRAINDARSDRTVILVAHRLTTLLNTDRIFVFSDGRVVESGTYEELVDLGGEFAELVFSASEEGFQMSSNSQDLQESLAVA